MIGWLDIQCEFCPYCWLWSRWCSQSKVYICFQLFYTATTTATASNKEFFLYMFWRLFGWSAKICDFQPEWHFVFLFVLKDLKREISRFVENGFPIFRSSCWPDLAQGSVCKQVCVVCSVRVCANKSSGIEDSQQVTAIRIARHKVTQCNPPVRKLGSPESDFCTFKLWEC